MAGKKWPKSKAVTIKLRGEHLEKKPKDMTMTEWVRGLIDNQDRFSDSTFKVVEDAPKQ